jgi:hypothetical protein
VYYEQYEYGYEYGYVSYYQWMMNYVQKRLRLENETSTVRVYMCWTVNTA